tara:strand:+ start:1867 stop:2040 length:174 start_codon:yes stop_codon:yes gene_type:complete
LKVDLNNIELNTILQAMNSVNIKGSDAVAYGTLLIKLTKAFDKEHLKADKVKEDGNI